MKKAAAILGLGVLALAAFASWQIAACHVNNSELQSDMQDLAVQSPGRIGLSEFSTEEDLRNAVISRAKEHGILLAPEQVTVERTLTPGMLQISLAADYEARVNLLGFSYVIHFAPSSYHSGEVVAK
jgi:hypothetical protein